MNIKKIEGPTIYLKKYLKKYIKWLTGLWIFEKDYQMAFYCRFIMKVKGPQKNI